MTRYELSYFFIPQMVKLCNEQKLDPQALLDLSFWKEVAQRSEENPKYEFEWENIGIDFKSIDENRAAIQITFPEPQIPVEAKYGCIIVDRAKKTFRYFTLEMEENGIWVIGSMTTEKHYDYGIYKELLSMEEFVSKVSGIK
jgi:hypothetical protein